MTIYDTVILVTLILVVGIICIYYLKNQNRK